MSLLLQLDRRGFQFGYGYRADAAALVRRMAGRYRLPDALRRAGTPARTGPPPAPCAAAIQSTLPGSSAPIWCGKALSLACAPMDGSRR